ncbi:hypothetical protein TOTORO_02950 [Serratia phage vB_SmaS-Totoro]|nr:hypothetical protein TOTORO_02950 [Serratia phage vB_SmaS-Totoro]
MNRQFVQEITTTLTKQVGLKRSLVTQALVLTLGYGLPLPNQGCEDPATYYQEHYESKIRNFANEFNERYLIDIGAVIEGVRQVWLDRYRALFINDVEQIKMFTNGDNPGRRYLSAIDQTLEESAKVAEAATILYPQISAYLMDATQL